MEILLATAHPAAKRLQSENCVVLENLPGPAGDRPAHRVVVVAPFGRDAGVLVEVLHKANIEAETFGETVNLAEQVCEACDALLLTEEALGLDSAHALVDAIAQQPAWSDLQVILLVSASPDAANRVSPVELLRKAGNVTILTRPVRAVTLVSAVEAALRARSRQHQLRLLMEREQEARAKAERALQLKDEFLATVSHELRTPISAVLLWARLLIKSDLDQEAAARGLMAIEASAESLSQLIEDLLDASRINAGKLELNLQKINVATAVAAAAEVTRAGAEAKGITVQTSLAGEVIVEADRHRLQQVLGNVLSNAVKFTPSGGHIHIGLVAEGSRACVEVRDTGKGVRADFLPFMFERFRQGEGSSQRRHGGLGLGLAISRDLMALHGGSIRAQSAGEGQGTTVIIELPLWAQQSTEDGAS